MCLNHADYSVFAFVLMQQVVLVSTNTLHLLIISEIQNQQPTLKVFAPSCISRHIFTQTWAFQCQTALESTLSYRIIAQYDNQSVQLKSQIVLQWKSEELKLIHPSCHFKQQYTVCSEFKLLPFDTRFRFLGAKYITVSIYTYCTFDCHQWMTRLL